MRAQGDLSLRNSKYRFPKDDVYEDMVVHDWRTTTFASGKRRVYATFESVKTVGGMRTSECRNKTRPGYRFPSGAAISTFMR